MLQDLHIAPLYDGMLFLAETTRHPPKLKSHHHVELELNLVVRGSITYIIGRQRYTFSARSLLWLYPDQEHQLVNASNDAQNYVAVFKPELMQRACRTDLYQGVLARRTTTESLLHTTLDSASFDLIRKTMDSLMPGSLDADVLNRAAGYGADTNVRFAHADPDGLNAGLHHLLLLCWRSQRNGKATGDAVPLHPAIRRALRILSEGRADENLDALAHRCKVSVAHLSRTFHRQVGVPLTRYRNNLRLSRFWEALQRDSMSSLSEAAFAAGFGSYAQFYKVFVATYGIGPGSCRTPASPQP